MTSSRDSDDNLPQQPACCEQLSRKSDSLRLEKLSRQLADPDGPPIYSRDEVEDLLRLYHLLDRRFERVVKISDSYQYELKELNSELHRALDGIKTLKGLIPICAACKKVRADDGYWRQIEQYLRENSEVHLSHGLCPECASNYKRLDRLELGSAENPEEFRVDLKEDELENPVIRHYLALINNEHFKRAPLRDDLLRLLEKFILQERRMRRIARISDKYQAEFREVKERYEREARRDHLTGLANRREIYRLIEGEIARVNRHGGELALIMFDCDNFKNINDNFGHEAGDHALQHCARLVASVVRREDSCGRWGGEEFLVVQPAASGEGVQLTAERLRSLFARSPVTYQDAEIVLTISLGVAIYRFGESTNDLLVRADNSLYHAKLGGKNRVGPLEE